MTTVITPIDQGVVLPAGLYTTVYSCPADATNAVINLRLASRTLDTDIKVRVANVPIAFTDGASAPDDSSWRQPVDIILGPSGVVTGILEINGMVVKAGRKLVAFGFVDGITASAEGFQKKIT